MPLLAEKIIRGADTELFCKQAPSYPRKIPIYKYKQIRYDSNVFDMCKAAHFNHKTAE